MSLEPTRSEKAQALRVGAVEVVRSLRDAGFEALWAGGCVRDQVMGVEPKDYDIATSATPEEVMDTFARTVPVGVQFGVVMVLHGGYEYEVATFRAEATYSDGRRPDSVEWSSAREDVLRRDFTINGLLYDPTTDEIIDHVGGVEDIHVGIVRAIGDAEARFEEDRLRMMRALRFAARFGFAVESKTWRALRVHASAVAVVSAERIANELSRILTEGGAARGLTLLHRAELLERVLPQAGDARRTAARLEHEGRLSAEVGWTEAVFEGLADADAAEELGQRLRLPTALWRHVWGAVDIGRLVRRGGYDDLGVAGRKRVLRRPEIDTALGVLKRGARLRQWPDGPVKRLARDRRRWAHELHPPRLVTGRDLAELGLAPGPRYGRILEAVEDAQLEGRATTRAEVLEVAQRTAAALEVAGDSPD